VAALVHVPEVISHFGKGALNIGPLSAGGLGGGVGLGGPISSSIRRAASSSVTAYQLGTKKFGSRARRSNSARTWSALVAVSKTKITIGDFSSPYF
jgi:hypothetical protein